MIPYFFLVPAGHDNSGTSVDVTDDSRWFPTFFLVPTGHDDSGTSVGVTNDSLPFTLFLQAMMILAPL